MAQNAVQTRYRKEQIAAFEKRQALTRATVTTEADIQANSAVFLVAGSGGATAVSRGLNGEIPSRPDDLNQYTATLKEWHDKPTRTRFNIYTSQGNGAAIMRDSSLAVINRQVDNDIREALALATATPIAMVQTDAKTFLAGIQEAIANLGEQEALDEEPFALITPAFRANLMALNQFSSVDYVNGKAFENISRSKAFNWNGVNWIVDSAAEGVTTASADCYMYNKNAVGHACDINNISCTLGYDDEDDYSWARTSIFMGSKILQNSGIVTITHDDTSFIAA